MKYLQSKSKIKKLYNQTNKNELDLEKKKTSLFKINSTGSAFKYIKELYSSEWIPTELLRSIEDWQGDIDFSDAHSVSNYQDSNDKVWEYNKSDNFSTLLGDMLLNGKIRSIYYPTMPHIIAVNPNFDDPIFSYNSSYSMKIVDNKFVIATSIIASCSGAWWTASKLGCTISIKPPLIQLEKPVDFNSNSILKIFDFNYTGSGTPYIAVEFQYKDPLGTESNSILVIFVMNPSITPEIQLWDWWWDKFGHNSYYKLPQKISSIGFAVNWNSSINFDEYNNPYAPWWNPYSGKTEPGNMPYTQYESASISASIGRMVIGNNYYEFKYDIKSDEINISDDLVPYIHTSILDKTDETIKNYHPLSSNKHKILLVKTHTEEDKPQNDKYVILSKGSYFIPTELFSDEGNVPLVKLLANYTPPQDLQANPKTKIIKSNENN